MVSGLGEEAVRALLEERRRNGPYAGVDDLGRRVRLDRIEAEALAGSGALDSLDAGSSCASKPSAFWPGPPRGGSPRPGNGSSSRIPPRVPAPRPPGEGTECPGAGGWRPGCDTWVPPSTSIPWNSIPGPWMLPGPSDGSWNPWRAAGWSSLGWPITAKPVLTASEEPMEFVSFRGRDGPVRGRAFPGHMPEIPVPPLRLQASVGPGPGGGGPGAVVLSVDSLAAIE
ncbi:MAG: hypothetical protein M0C28_21725 [Candidatus Moduliflexus flocculans]|nr:hypothetical protein [Candidatus Moduliflexus flocculans]